MVAEAESTCGRAAGVPAAGEEPADAADESGAAGASDSAERASAGAPTLAAVSSVSGFGAEDGRSGATVTPAGAVGSASAGAGVRESAVAIAVAAGSGPTFNRERNSAKASRARSANGCAGSPTNAGDAKATAADIPSMAMRATLRRRFACSATRPSDGTGGAPFARGVRKTAGTTIVAAVTRETGAVSLVCRGIAIRVSGVTSEGVAGISASRASVQPSRSDAARSGSSRCAAVTSMSSRCGRQAEKSPS